jgi:hypothetical protein
MESALTSALVRSGRLVDLVYGEYSQADAMLHEAC